MGGHRIEDFEAVMGENQGGHSDGDPHNSLNENDGNLCREHHRFLVSSIIGLDPLRQLGIVEDLFRERQEATFDISGSGRAVTGQDVSEVSLAIDEQIVVGEVHQRFIDRCIAVRMEAHRPSHRVGDLVEFAVIHLKESMDDSSLNRFEAIHQIGNRPFLDHVGGILQEVLAEELMRLSHQIRFSMMKERRSGVLLPI